MEEIILGNQRIPTQLYSSKIFSFIILSDKPNSKRKIFPYKFCFLSFSLEKKQSVILYAIHTLSWKGSIFLALDLHTYTWGSYRNIWTFKQDVYNRSLNLFISINYLKRGQEFMYWHGQSEQEWCANHEVLFSTISSVIHLFGSSYKYS